ncbi:competence protein ComK [Sporosarcina sp. E16_3]|uniref:competence protein ComK n=1 Tax=Sporosarcina sp. E16_3 TaxID=2789293 RepID=UPI001A92A07E|nr:competence protein ComK [Sporosarcina sp. E16_3]MBO0603758.1 competence protein ComK [Sporosarcina sp. E16_3]
MRKCDSFLINRTVLAVKAFFMGDNKSEILTTHGIYYSVLTPLDLLNKACINYYSTWQGRTNVAKNLLNYSKKPPFIIVPNEIGVFPTKSSDSPDCVFIFNHYISVEEVAKGQSVITFMPGISITVNVSKNTILKQYQRLHTLMSVSNLRHQEKELYDRENGFDDRKDN